MRIVKPVDPALPSSGVLAIFDRNLNSNTVLGLDFSGPSQNVDQGGRPNFFNQVSVDANESSGLYDEAYSQGTIQIHYIPSGKQTPGVFSQGTAIIKIRLQIYTGRSTSCWPTRVSIRDAGADRATCARCSHELSMLRSHFLQRRGFVQGDMVSLVARDFILWVILTRMVRVSLVVNILAMHLGDAANLAGFRIPGHMIANLESLRHDDSPPIKHLNHF